MLPRLGSALDGFALMWAWLSVCVCLGCGKGEKAVRWHTRHVVLIRLELAMTTLRSTLLLFGESEVVKEVRVCVCMCATA